MNDVKLNEIIWWLERNNLKLQKKILKRLEEEGKVINVRGPEGSKRRKGSFPEGSLKDFMDELSNASEQAVLGEITESFGIAMEEENDEMEEEECEEYDSDVEEEEDDEEAIEINPIPITANIFMQPIA